MNSRKNTESKSGARTFHEGVAQIWGWLKELHYSEADRLYAYRQVVMIICLAFFPPFITFFGLRLLHIPLMVMGVFIAISFLGRKKFRQEISASIKRPAIFILLLFVLYQLLHLALWSLHTPELIEPRVLQKPFFVFVSLLLIAYVLSFPSESYLKYLPHVLEFAIYTGLAIAFFYVAINYALRVLDREDLYGTFGLSSRLINGGLKPLVILSLLLGAIPTRHQTLKFVVVVLALFVLSLVSVGTVEWHGKDHIWGIRSETVQFGLPIAMVVYLLARLAPKIMTHVVFGSTALLLCVIPWLVQYWVVIAPGLALPGAKNFLNRAEIWDATARKALESPWIGHGIDSVRYLQNLELRQVYLKYEQIVHPHNVFIQIWVDLGIVGVALWLGLLYCGWQFVRQIPLVAKPAILASPSLLFLTALVTHSMWQTRWIAVTTIICALIIIVGRQPGNDSKAVPSDKKSLF